MEQVQQNTIATIKVYKVDKEEKIVYTKCQKFPRWKFIPIYDDINEVLRALIKQKILVPSPNPITHPSFVAWVPKECKSYEFYKYHQQQGHAIKHYVTLPKKILDVINQKKAAFIEPKSDDQPKLLRHPHHEKNKTMGIFKNPFLNFIKYKS